MARASGYSSSAPQKLIEPHVVASFARSSSWFVTAAMSLNGVPAALDAPLGSNSPYGHPQSHHIEPRPVPGATAPGAVTPLRLMTDERASGCATTLTPGWSVARNLSS